MNIAKALTLSFPAVLLIVFSCSIKEKSITTAEAVMLESNTAHDSATAEVKYYDIIDKSIPGNLATNPDNYKEILPVRWDGKSKLKSGVTYSGHSSELEKLAEVDERYRDLVEFRKEMMKKMEKQKEAKGDSTANNN